MCCVLRRKREVKLTQEAAVATKSHGTSGQSYSTFRASKIQLPHLLHVAWPPYHSHCLSTISKGANLQVIRPLLDPFSGLLFLIAYERPSLTL